MQRTKKTSGFLLRILVTSLLLASTLSFGAEPNGQGVCRFDFSEQKAWKLDSGEGTILPSVAGVQGAVLQVKGNGQGGNRWIHSGFSYNKVRDAGTQSLCMLRFKARNVQKAGGSCMAGSLFSYKEFAISKDWNSFRMIFPISKRVNKDAVRLILYSGRSTFQFAEAEVLPVVASFGPYGLARGEKYNPQAGTWSYRSQFASEGGSWSPALKDFNCVFNSNRWNFGSKAFVTWCFTAPNKESFNGGKIDTNFGFYTSGNLFVEFSTDGKEWTLLGETKSSSSPSFTVPAVKTPTAWIRFRTDKESGMQLTGFQFNAKLADRPGRVKNQQAEKGFTEGVPVTNSTFCGSTTFWEVVKGDSQVPAEVLPSLQLSNEKTGMQTQEESVRWKDASGKDCSATLRCQYFNNDYYREDYGYRLNDIEGKEVAVWWTDATHKIYPGRKIPEKKASTALSRALSLDAAGNDLESVQLVLYPKRNATISQITVTDFTSDKKDVISSKNIEIRRPYYHDVQAPSDRISPLGLLPDALPPMNGEVNIAARTNFPIWLTVHVPAGTAPGDYTAMVTVPIRSEKSVLTLSVPIKLHVWDFDLPAENTVETAFGFNPSLCWKYHHLSKPEDKVKLLDRYFRLLGRNRISVYDPTPFVSIGKKYVVDKEHPEKSHAVLDFTAFDKALEEAVKKYRFNRFRFSLPGMGGGTFEKRIDPQIAGYKVGTPEFDALFASVAKQMEQHLIEKGWIDKFYLYWFDEPDEKDYPFVRDGMKRVKKYAPRIRTMLTEEPLTGSPGENGILGKVDIWAMIIDRYNDQLADECRTHNEAIWTYMTNVPTPYPAQFMEHSATDLRVWLWQTWKYKCSGVLIWTINYWTSTTAFPDPDHPQNPYVDPGTYQTGYGLAKGIKNLWGNGDARLVYPPLSCAVPAKEPNFDEPVSSIRLEMVREGIEDFEMLALLKARLADAKNLSETRKAELQKLLDVPADIASGWTSFTTDPAPIYRHRKKVAEAIESLKK